MLYFTCLFKRGVNSQFFSAVKKEERRINVKSKIKWFNNEKGYGFIENSNGEDIFVHYSEINMDGYKTLKEGNYVKFDLINTPKGLQARNVSTLGSRA